MYAGFCNAYGDYVVVLDADMQDPPSLLPEMLSILEKGEYDSVAARRVDRAGYRQSEVGLQGSFIILSIRFPIWILWMAQGISV